MEAWQSLSAALQQWEWIGALVARVAVGTLFGLSGRGKLFVPERRAQMRDTLRAGGVPVPDVSAVVLSSIEMVFGALLVLGLATPLCCVMLSGVMLGALATTILPGIEARSVADWLGEVLYLPEVLYLVILLWLLLAGPGQASVDHLLLL